MASISESPQMSRALKEYALDMVRASLEEGNAAHPLDISNILSGGSTPLSMNRAVRLFALRETLGAKLSAGILEISGRKIAGKLGIESMSDLVDVLGELGVRRVSVDESAPLTITAAECATCGGVPYVGEPLCYFETGLIAGAAERILCSQVKATEVRCFGLGDDSCMWKVERVEAEPDSLDLLMMLAGSAASAIDNSAAVRQKNRELRDACRKLRESERTRRDLTDMIVHDMRVPLTSIIGCIQALEDTDGDRLSPNGTEFLAMALSGGRTLLNLVNDLLDISKLEEGKFVPKRRMVPLAEIVDSAAGQIEALAAKHSQQLQVEPVGGCKVFADPERMVRVVVNLLANAVRHTPAGGTISLSAVSGGGSVCVSIADTGEGIPAEYHESIFEKFVHGPGKRSSTGLGLAFCKLMVEAHGGRIWVESKPGVGSTFKFQIPSSQATL